MPNEITNEFVEYLLHLARSATWSEDSQNDGDEYFDINSYCGGNFDDAYHGGADDGKILLAREVLDEMNINWKED